MSEEEEEYQVEAIRAWRWHLNQHHRLYLIKWINYDEADNTWEPEYNLNCPELLRKFEKALDQNERIFYNAKPKRLSGFERRAVFLGLVGVDGPSEADLDPVDKKPRLGNNHYCLLKFDDADQPEEITLAEFFLNQPDAAFKYCEQRLINRQSIKSKK